MSKTERDFLAVGGLFITLIGIFFVFFAFGIMKIVPTTENLIASLDIPILGIVMYLVADFYKGKARRRAQKIKALRSGG